MLTHEQRQLIHDDFVKATDFLVTTYRVYKQMINVDPNNRLDHMTNWHKVLRKGRNCFKCHGNMRSVLTIILDWLQVFPLHLILRANLVNLLWNRPVLKTWHHLHDLRWTLSIGYWINLRCIMMGMPHQTHWTHPSPRGSTTPVTMATAFCPIEKTPPTLTGAQLTQVSHSQALNLLHKSPSTSGSIVRRPNTCENSGSACGQIWIQCRTNTKSACYTS